MTMIADIAHLGLLDDDAIMLDAAALELAALDHPGVSLDPHIDLLAGMTDRLIETAPAARTAAEQAAMLAEIVAGEQRFTGDRRNYDDPANADLIQVIERRRGLPVALAIIYVALARRVGWTAYALNTPGHVLGSVIADEETVLFDPFADGAAVDARGLAALLETALGREARLQATHLAPMSNRTVLVRLLMNQATRAEGGGDAARALTLFERITTIAPAHPHGWWERARLELAHGRRGAARASLSAMLETTRDPALRMHANTALDTLAGQTD